MKRVSRGEFLKNIHSRTYSGPFEAFLCSMGSASQLRRNLENISGTYNAEVEEARRMHHRYDMMICRLKQDGLLKQDISLTQKGLRFVTQFLKHKPSIPVPSSYEPEAEKGVVLVSFDIPEKQRKYRAWLRDVLRQLNFEMLHKSVWFGNTKIPKSLLKDLRDFRLASFIEILEISKQGTIEKVLNKK
jgi:DNA-binding transcriptional regulator PaaX